MTELLELAGVCLTLASSSYALIAWLLPPNTWRAEAPSGERPSVSVLKPLYGFDSRLEENLRSLVCAADSEVEILCGVRDPADGAIDVVKRLQQEYPACRLTLVVDPRVHGHNLKVSNVMNLFQRAQGELLVIADSDILVGADYVRRVVAPLADPRVGLVTCLYRGRARSNLLSRIGSLFVDTWFIPSVGVASHLGERSFGFGSTVAMSRRTLEAIGGLEAVKDQLADDYWIGELIYRLGLKTVLSDVWVETDVVETSFAKLWQREVRWMRTIRSINRAGFSMTFITHTVPMLLLGVLLDSSEFNLCVAAVGLLARIGLQRRAGQQALWLMPLRDGLLLLEWAAALFGQRVTWRDQTLHVNTDSLPIASSSLPNEADVL
jgi:ceramide glucosyltransferase